MQQNETILSFCDLRLKEFCDFYVETPFATGNLAELLKQLPRTGKAVRLRRLNLPQLKARSVYDHILSLAQSAALFLPCYPQKLNPEILSAQIVYHDVNEVLLGDIPNYTDIKEQPVPNCWTQLKKTEKAKRERIANSFLALFANKAQQKSLRALKLYGAEKDFCDLLDKIDPIIAVWRYLFVYRDQLLANAEQFIDAMRDFFENPLLKEYAKNCPIKILKRMLPVLTDKNSAAEYLRSGNLQEIVTFECYETFQTLIEKTPLFFN